MKTDIETRLKIAEARIKTLEESVNKCIKALSWLRCDITDSNAINTINSLREIR